MREVIEEVFTAVLDYLIGHGYVRYVNLEEQEFDAYVKYSTFDREREKRRKVSERKI